jgi:peptidoglycan/LPS O-acetylase OafA/YrhL
MLTYRPLRGTAASDHLDLVRGVAALAVLFGHLRNLFFLNHFDAALKPDLLVRIIFSLSGYAHGAVMIFFVLSGFLIGGTVLRGRMDGNFNWSPYALNRLTRLWVVLIPALLLGGIWDHFGILFFGTSGIYGGLPPKYGAMIEVLPRLSGSVLLGNVFFLQGILTPEFGSNVPLWSLSYEFWYYVLFPLIALTFPMGKLGRSTVLYAIATFVVLWFMGRAMSFYFLIWLLGAALNFLPEQSANARPIWVVATIAVVMLVLAIFKSKLEVAEYHDFIVGIASAVLIYALSRSNSQSAPGPYSRITRRLAGFSYTLYLVHRPALNFIAAWLVPRQRWQPDPAHIAIVTAIGICTLAYAFAVAQFTECRTGAIRPRLMAVFGIQPESNSRLGVAAT